MIVTRGYGTYTNVIVLRGYGLSAIVERRLFLKRAAADKYKNRYIKERIEARKFIMEVKSNIDKTGIVRNTHKSYHPRWNPRVKVSDKRASVVAYDIAKRRGMRVPRKPIIMEKKDG